MSATSPNLRLTITMTISRRLGFLATTDYVSTFQEFCLLVNIKRVLLIN